MNDFTKEDLIKLHIALKWVGMATPDQVDNELMNRIAEMVDNHCEHQRCSPTDMLGVPLHCLDCGVKFE